MAWLCLYQPRFSKQTFELADFHPFMKKKWITPDEFTEDRKKLKGYLPATLTNEEREVRWELWNQKQEARKNVSK